MTLVAKLPSPTHAIRAFKWSMRCWHTEMWALRCLRSTSLLRVPELYLAEEEQENHVLLIEDLGDNQFDASAVTLATVTRIVEALASWQAQLWEKIPPALSEHLPRDDVGARRQFVLDAYSRLGIATIANAEHLPPQVRRGAAALCDLAGVALDRLGTAPFTVRHGDLHLGNMIENGFLRPSIGVVDWETASLGRGVADLPAVVVDLLSTEDRRRHEQQLVQLYVQLVGEICPGYSFEEAWHDYKCAVLSWFIRRVALGVSGGGLPRDGAFERLVACVVDLGWV